MVGTYEKTFIVDGVEFELYAQLGASGVVGYQLVASDGALVTEQLLLAVPAQAEVEALVRPRPAA